MSKKMMCIVSLLALSMLFACQAAEEPKTQSVKETVQTPVESAAKAVQDTSVRKMSVTGAIGKGENSYVIRGKVPSMIFTILNPDPAVLDEFAATEKEVKIEVRIVSGDNVTIEMLDGKEYTKKIQ